jgi:hypothetical protein
MKSALDTEEIIFQASMEKGSASGHKAHIPIYIISIILGLGFGAGLYFLRMSGWEGGLRTALILLALVVALQIPVLIFALKFSAKELFLYPDRLVLRMQWGQRVIPLSEIKELKALEPDEAKRTFLRSSAINMTMSIRNAVMISRTRGRPYIINPENREEFLQAFSRVFHQESASDGSEEE